MRPARPNKDGADGSRIAGLMGLFHLGPTPSLFFILRQTFTYGREKRSENNNRRDDDTIVFLPFEILKEKKKTTATLLLL